MSELQNKLTNVLLFWNGPLDSVLCVKTKLGVHIWTNGRTLHLFIQFQVQLHFKMRIVDMFTKSGWIKQQTYPNELATCTASHCLGSHITEMIDHQHFYRRLFLIVNLHFDRFFYSQRTLAMKNHYYRSSTNRCVKGYEF